MEINSWWGGGLKGCQEALLGHARDLGWGRPQGVYDHMFRLRLLVSTNREYVTI